MKQKMVKQPIITDAEIAKTERYNRDIQAWGYRPWVTVRQSHTHGQGQIVYSHKTKREHHLLRRGERRPFFYFEHDPTVIDILEQYPLPLHKTLEIAASLNIVHPGNYKERGNHGGRIPAKTMTQDFLVLRQSDSGNARLTAYSYKYSDALDPAITNPRVVNRTRAKEKIALEYWRAENIDFVMVTEKDFDATFIYNVEFLRECFDSKNLLQVSADLYDHVVLKFKNHMIMAPLSTLRMLALLVAQEMNIDERHAVCLFQHAVYTGRIDMDLTQRIELYHPLPALRGSHEN